MAEAVCKLRLADLVKVAIQYRSFMYSLCVLNMINSLVASLGNFLVIRALWKSSSIPCNLRKFFISLALSDLAVGLWAELLYGAVIAVMLSETGSGNRKPPEYLCPSLITFSYFLGSFLACASFLNITAIAVDRHLALSLHLRYQEIVTSKRVVRALVCLWTASVIYSAVFVSVYKISSIGTIVIEVSGLLVAAVAYIRIYQVVRYHQVTIERQLQLQYEQAVELLREKKSAINCLFVYLAFVTCYLPHLCTIILMIVRSTSISLVAAYHGTAFFVLLNSSLNPVLYCWRYREIREIVKRNLNAIFRRKDAN
ncbi:melanocyte-stimulating hormone receptor-like [Acropora muricata]|uniref:melanocyte-stimulating hormone receptor-like n=1 Tax=Acropora muricata TaxID=159855 RepID=UPI0034E410BD